MVLNLTCCFSISANRCKQKDCFLWKNMRQSMSRNWENSSSMLQSPPKYLFSIEIEISATVLGNIQANRFWYNCFACTFPKLKIYKVAPKHRNFWIATSNVYWKNNYSWPAHVNYRCTEKMVANILNWNISLKNSAAVREIPARKVEVLVFSNFSCK